MLNGCFSGKKEGKYSLRVSRVLYIMCVLFSMGGASFKGRDRALLIMCVVSYGRCQTQVYKP